MSQWSLYGLLSLFFFSSRRRHTRCALVTGVQTCALPIWMPIPRGVKWGRIEAYAPHSITVDTVARFKGLERAIIILWGLDNSDPQRDRERSEEHTSELQSLMRISYAVFCLKKKIPTTLSPSSCTRIHKLPTSTPMTQLYSKTRTHTTLYTSIQHTH